MVLKGILKTIIRGFPSNPFSDSLKKIFYNYYAISEGTSKKPQE